MKYLAGRGYCWRPPFSEKQQLFVAEVGASVGEGQQSAIVCDRWIWVKGTGKEGKKSFESSEEVTLGN